MADIPKLKLAEQTIKETIVPNGVRAITGQIMQDVLTGITEAAIEDINTMASTIDTEIENFVFQTKNYGDNTITSQKIVASSITESHLATNSVSNTKIVNGSVTTEKLATSGVTTDKLADNAVTTPKIMDLNVTRGKLSTDVTNMLLTVDQQNYINEKMREDLQKEAQTHFSGTTSEGGTTTYIFGEVTSANAQKTVRVSLKFSNVAVSANATPSGWGKSGNDYTYTLSMANSKTSVASTRFNYTPTSGIYSGLTVTYDSTAASIAWKYPVYYGFVSGNTASVITRESVSGMTYSTSDVSTTTTIANNTGKEAYLCILTRNTATAQQLGINILGNPINNVSFISPKNTSIQMTGYKAYFSKNTVSAGGSLGNVTLNIKC